MIKSIFTRVLVTVALICASIAWAGWAYLHSIADAHRAERITTEVLADPAAQRELAEPLADQIVDQAGLEPGVTPLVRDAVVAVMADPRITTNLTAAIGSAHARSFGVDDPRPATVDGAVLVAAVRDHLGVASPELAVRIPLDLVGDIKVPEVELPFIAGLRSLATTAVEWGGAAAIGLLTFALLAGDRRFVLRRYGYWAIAAGLTWAVGPRLVVFIARRFLPAIDATLAAGVGAATNTVTFAATIVVATGVGSVVASRVLRSMPSQPASLPREARGRSDALAGRPHRDAVAPVAPRERVATSYVTDAVAPPPPIVPPPIVSPRPTSGPESTSVMPAVDANPALSDLVTRLQPTAAPPPEVEIDPWALFGGPAIEPSTGKPLTPRIVERAGDEVDDHP